ncbi:MAG: hypothetical protein O2985_17530 [Proteobacteria bacterium]|nr:hypothetical protein [Pseudomonadota bacterium]
MALDANELKARVRDFIQMEGWSMSRLAKSAGLRPSTLQDAANRTWNPTSETLQACMDVVNSQIPREPRPEAKPVAHTLPIAFLSKPWNREFSDCMEIWRSQNGQFSELLFQKLGTTRMGED